MTLALPDMLGFALYSASHAVHAAYTPLLQPLGLTYPQYLVLMSLQTQEGQTVGQLGAALRLDSNTLTPLLKRMETAGWVRRHRDSNDERQVRLTLTDQGRTLAERATGIPDAFAQKTGFQPSELADLHDILAALRDRLKPARP